MAGRWHKILVLALVIFPSKARAEEAVTPQGRRFFGNLQKKDFLLANTNKTLSLEQLLFVQFPENPAPVPRCRLLHQLLLAGEQQLTGALLAVKSNQVRFRIVTGEIIKLPLKQIQGIVSADGNLIQLGEDFESEGDPAAWLGKPIFSGEHVFSGQKSLLLNSSSGQISLNLGPARRAGPGKAGDKSRSARGTYPGEARRATLFFFDSGLPEAAAAGIEFVFQAQETPTEDRTPVALLLANKNYGLENGQGYLLKPGPGWHIMQIDWKGREGKVFIDDYFLGLQKIPQDAHLASLRFSFRGPGSMWLDAFHLAEKVPPLKHLPGPPELDEIWLASGDQVFGTIIQADEKEIALEAGFGKSAFPWSNVRGIFFRTEAKPPSLNGKVDIRFRSGPGMSLDRLQGAIVDLDNRRLLLRQDVLGELTIERSRLERIRFPR